MYNKLFTQILDSSIWLETHPTRIVWMTLLAAMDETGFARFAAPENLATRARVTMEEVQAAIKCLESPDEKSPGQEDEGRRIERVPGGWVVRNAIKYKKIANRAAIQEQTRLRTIKYREQLRAEGLKKRSEKERKGVTHCDASNVTNTGCDAPVTHCDENVTPSETGSETYLRPSRVARPGASVLSKMKMDELKLKENDTGDTRCANAGVLSRLLSDEEKVDTWDDKGAKKLFAILHQARRADGLYPTAWGTQLQAWRIKNNIEKGRIKAVVLWLPEHIADKYTPKIFSMKTFIEKFPRLEEAVRQTKASDNGTHTHTEEELDKLIAEGPNSHHL